MKNQNSILNPFSYLKRKGLQKQGTKAFTLVELIVVITILAILSTIGFVAYSGYLVGTRDTSRIASLKAISEGLEMYSTRHDLPTPDEKTTKIMSGTTQIATQGYVGENVLETITYSTEGKDPKDGTYYSYYLTKDKKYFQLMAFLEEEKTTTVYNQKPGQTHRSAPTEKNVGVNLCVHPVGCNTANAVDYSTRYPTVFGKKLGILTTKDNEPIQESTGTIDISNVGTLELKSYLKDNDYLSGTGITFKYMSNFAKKGGKFCATTNKICTDPNDLTIPTEGLIAYLPLKYNANGEIGSYNGTANGGVVFDGISANFDGVDDYIDLNTLNLTNVKTLSIWFKTSNSSERQAIFSQGDSGGTDFNLLEIHKNNHTLRFTTTNGNDPAGTTIINDGNWHHVVLFKNNENKFKLYLDGILEIDSNDNVWFGTDTDTDTNTIGACKRNSLVSELEGSLSNLIGYNRILTEEEIGIIYTKEKEDF